MDVTFEWCNIDAMTKQNIYSFALISGYDNTGEYLVEKFSARFTLGTPNTIVFMPKEKYVEFCLKWL
jgi:hypothetical protein